MEQYIKNFDLIKIYYSQEFNSTRYQESVEHRISSFDDKEIFLFCLNNFSEFNDVSAFVFLLDMIKFYLSKNDEIIDISIDLVKNFIYNAPKVLLEKNIDDQLLIILFSKCLNLLLAKKTQYFCTKDFINDVIFSFPEVFIVNFFIDFVLSDNSSFFMESDICDIDTDNITNFLFSAVLEKKLPRSVTALCEVSSFLMCKMDSELIECTLIPYLLETLPTIDDPLSSLRIINNYIKHISSIEHILKLIEDNDLLNSIINFINQKEHKNDELLIISSSLISEIGQKSIPKIGFVSAKQITGHELMVNDLTQLIFSIIPQLFNSEDYRVSIPTFDFLRLYPLPQPIIEMSFHKLISDCKSKLREDIFTSKIIQLLQTALMKIPLDERYMHIRDLVSIVEGNETLECVCAVLYVLREEETRLLKTEFGSGLLKRCFSFIMEVKTDNLKCYINALHVFSECFRINSREFDKGEISQIILMFTSLLLEFSKDSDEFVSVLAEALINIIFKGDIVCDFFYNQSTIYQLLGTLDANIISVLSCYILKKDDISLYKDCVYSLIAYFNENSSNSIISSILKMMDTCYKYSDVNDELVPVVYEIVSQNTHFLAKFIEVIALSVPHDGDKIRTLFLSVHLDDLYVLSSYCSSGSKHILLSQYIISRASVIFDHIRANESWMEASENLRLLSHILRHFSTCVVNCITNDLHTVVSLCVELLHLYEETRFYGADILCCVLRIMKDLPNEIFLSLSENFFGTIMQLPVVLSNFTIDYTSPWFSYLQVFLWRFKDCNSNFNDMIRRLYGDRTEEFCNHLESCSIMSFYSKCI